MPFSKTCLQCSTTFTAQKQTAKFCSSRCFGLANTDAVVARNKARRKYPEVGGLTKSQASYRRHNGVYRLRDIEKRQNLLIALGGECVLCGYDKDLRGMVLDHKHGDGAEDRKRLGSKAFRYYINNLHEAAEKLQVLCATCNQIKAYENREHNKSRRVIKV
jgi:hypothetical protein